LMGACYSRTGTSVGVSPLPEARRMTRGRQRGPCCNDTDGMGDRRGRTKALEAP